MMAKEKICHECLSPSECSSIGCQELVTSVSNQTLIFRLRKRAAIRRQILSRKSVQEGAPDRIADLLEEAATALELAKNNTQKC
jgi:hypothetical protein